MRRRSVPCECTAELEPRAPRLLGFHTPVGRMTRKSRRHRPMLANPKRYTFANLSRNMRAARILFARSPEWLCTLGTPQDGARSAPACACWKLLGSLPSVSRKRCSCVSELNRKLPLGLSLACVRLRRSKAREGRSGDRRSGLTPVFQHPKVDSIFFKLTFTPFR
jgi:hypothetical protein